MTSVAVLDTQGGEVKQLELASSVFGAQISTHCVRAVVNRQLARGRQGTATAKNRAQVRGSGHKPWRQKGTGRARAGSVKSPIWRGGGKAFGPQPRQYGGRINRKVVRNAITSCLTALAQDKELIVVDTIEFAEPKTRQVLELLTTLKVDADRVLFLTETTNVNLALSARNIPLVDVINCDNLNVRDLTTHDVVIATAAAVERLQKVYAHEA